jgi:hypothetical protein
VPVTFLDVLPFVQDIVFLVATVIPVIEIFADAETASMVELPA